MTADPFGPASKPDRSNQPGPLFLAAYRSECWHCLGTIHEGDSASMHEGAAVHGHCAREIERERRNDALSTEAELAGYDPWETR